MDDLPDVRSDPPISTTQWMTNLPEKLSKVPITELAIPGSHNSGSYYLDPATPISPDKSRFVKTMGNCSKSVVINWSKCQSYSISEQLQHGIRYFDMRPGYLDFEDEFLFVHGVHGYPITNMLSDMREFLMRYQHEVVIVDFNHFHNFTPNLHARFVKMILNIFNDMLYPRDENNILGEVRFSLHDMREMNKQVFLSYKNPSICQQTKEFWPTKQSLYSPWFNTNSVQHLTSRLDNLQINMHPNKFNIYQAILTARKSTIALNSSSTLRSCLAVKCNQAVTSWLTDVFEQCKQGVNIVLCDFICEDGCVEHILRLNGNVPD